MLSQSDYCPGRINHATRSQKSRRNHGHEVLDIHGAAFVGLGVSAMERLSNAGAMSGIGHCGQPRAESSSSPMMLERRLET